MKNNKNYIGTFSKNNVPKLKNNESTIVNLANSNDVGTHWISMKLVDKKLFYFDSYAIAFIPDIIKQYPNSRIITKIYRIQSNSSNECGKFALMFVESDIKDESDYIKFSLKFEKDNFEKIIYKYICSYCLKCKRKTKNIDLKGFVTRNKKYLVKSSCNICRSKKSKFISEQEAQGFLSNLFSKILTLNKII